VSFYSSEDEGLINEDDENPFQDFGLIDTQIIDKSNVYLLHISFYFSNHVITFQFLI